MRAFVTGGAGFIGSHIVDELVRRNYDVVVYDNLSTGFQKHLRSGPAQNRARLIVGDILDYDKLVRSMKDVDVVFHLAANADVRRGFVETDLDLKQGVITTYNVLEAMRRTGVKSIIFSSSSVVYGNAEKKPTPEDYGPLLPVSFYGSAKLASEGLITAFSNLYGFRYYIFRFANIVGKNGTHGVIPDFVRKLKQNPGVLEVKGDGKQKKSYVTVEECVNAILYVYEKSKSNYNLFNISADSQVTVKEIAEMVRDAVSKEAKITYEKTREGWPGDITDSYLANAKLTGLGYNVRTTSTEAVKIGIQEALKFQ